MKVKSESEVAQLCPTLSNPMDCSLPGFSVHGIFHEYWSGVPLPSPKVSLGLSFRRNAADWVCLLWTLQCTGGLVTSNRNQCWTLN